MRIALFTGGTSEERQVSLSSGKEVLKALRSRGHTVHTVDTATGYVPADREADLFPAEVGIDPPDMESLRATFDESALFRITEADVVREADVVFLALHGSPAEDGKLQAMLDLAGIRYTGTGSLGSAVAMDKRLSKELFDAAGVPTAPWAPRNRGYEEILDDLGLPLVVKPSGGGSTIGLTVVHDAVDLGPAMQLAEGYDRDVLVERFVPGRELTVGILLGEALPVLEITPSHEIYDYECKYTPGMTSYEVPARLEPGEAEELARLSLAAHQVLRQGSFGRVDFVRGEEDGVFYCLETNSLPGMTSTSLLPTAAASVGITFPELCERIAIAALEGE
ncbi:MAG: D-alanine--D-alanine ligase [Gemmatimonadales bacterium]